MKGNAEKTILNNANALHFAGSFGVHSGSVQNSDNQFLSIFTPAKSRFPVNNRNGCTGRHISAGSSFSTRTV